jgi:hypothetical protein
MLDLPYQEKRKEGDTMSANVYTISSLLVGTRYISNSLRGEIVSAEVHPKAVWYEGCESYLVEVKPQYGFKNQFRTVAVRKEN